MQSRGNEDGNKSEQTDGGDPQANVIERLPFRWNLSLWCHKGDVSTYLTATPGLPIKKEPSVSRGTEVPIPNRNWLKRFVRCSYHLPTSLLLCRTATPKTNRRIEHNLFVEYRGGPEQPHNRRFVLLTSSRKTARGIDSCTPCVLFRIHARAPTGPATNGNGKNATPERHRPST